MSGSASHANELPGTVKVVTVWLLVGAALFLAYQWWERESRMSSFSADGDVVEIRRAADGHYHWPGRINGTPVDFLVDTGATGVAIPTALARELGLAVEGTSNAMTAGGAVTGEVVRADLSLQGGVTATRLRMVALPALESPLLGMAVLGRLPWQQRGDTLVVDLRPASGRAASEPRAKLAP